MSIISFLLFVQIFGVFCTEWNPNDYMKREHSLLRPYQGYVLKLSSAILITISYCIYFFFIMH